MALRLIESFDTFATAHLTEGRWSATGTGIGTTVTVAAGTGRRGTQSCRLTVSSTTRSAANLRKTLTNQPTWIVGCAFRTSVVGNPASDILSVRDGGTTQIDVVRNSTGTLSVTRAGTVLGTSTASLTNNTFAFVELKTTIHATTGSVQLRINGSLEITLTNQNTQQTANSYAQEVVLGNSRLTSIAGGTTCTDDYDDVYLCDGTGAAPYQDVLGDCRVDALFPTSDASVAWTPSAGTDHFALVDEMPPNTTDYVDSVTVGQIDRYGFPDLPVLTSPTVYAVAVTTYAQNPEGGGRQLVATVQSGASTQDGPALALTNTWRLDQSLFVTDPNGGGAWTQASVNAASFGVKVSP